MGITCYIREQEISLCSSTFILNVLPPVLPLSGSHRKGIVTILLSEAHMRAVGPRIEVHIFTSIVAKQL